MPDAIVIGAGPNGLTAAAYLARAGMKVLVLEAQPEPGGAVRTVESTLPGFRHDVGAAFFPFGESPAFRGLDLPGAGLVWRHAPLDSAHPAPDGSSAAIGRDLEASARALGADADAWRDIAVWHARARDRLLETLLGTLPPVGPALRLGPGAMLRLARVALSSGRGFSEATFSTDAARRIVPGLALHTDVGPDDPCGAIVGFMLAVMASSDGFGVPEGGAGSITKALLRRVEEAGGEVRCGARVEKIVVRGERAVAVRLAGGASGGPSGRPSGGPSGGEEIEASQAIVADVAAPALYLDMLARDDVPEFVRFSMRNFRHGFATFKMDWALSGPVPWSSEDAARSAVVHAGDSNRDLAAFVREVRAGDLPTHPYLVVGQQSLADPTRAPKGKHTLWAYSRVPFSPRDLPGGWAAHKARFADRIEARLEELAPGFRSRILARNVVAPPDLEAMDENLVGGDLAGGSADIRHQLFFRPVFPYFRYRTPVARLYLGSSYAHPGAGVHGACGRNAALAVLRDVGA